MATRKDAEEALRVILDYITAGNPGAEVRENTPKRVVDSYDELFGGYSIDPEVEFSKSFPNDFSYENFVLIKDIRFSSTCEHHLLPIRGLASVAYIPDQNIIGLSKVCRMVEAASRRLQLQERMTKDIVDLVEKYIKPKGCAVYVSAEHDCMSLRGIKKHDSKTVTYLFTGEFKDSDSKKSEFLQFVK